MIKADCLCRQIVFHGAIYAKENLTRKNLKEPTINEIAAEIGISKEDIVYALDAIQNPMSLYYQSDTADLKQVIHIFIAWRKAFDYT